MPKFDFTAVPTNELIRMRDELDQLISDRKVEDLTKRMQELLDEIHAAGHVMSFEAEVEANTEYRKHDVMMIYSDEPTFSFEVM